MFVKALLQSPRTLPSGTRKSSSISRQQLKSNCNNNNKNYRPVTATHAFSHRHALLFPHHQYRHLTTTNNSRSDEKYGQPHPKTHPHLLKSDELTIGVPKDEYARRRAEFVSRIPEGAAAIFPSALHCIMSSDIPYPYRQNSDFYYLSGFFEPESLLILERRESKPIFTMLVAKRDPAREMWDGPRTGVERAKHFLGADYVYEITEIDKFLSKVLSKATVVYFNDIPTKVTIPDYLKNSVGIDGNTIIQSPRSIIEQQRLIKSAVEIELMRKGGIISGESFKAAMKYTKPGQLESEIEAYLEFQCRKRGAFRLSYPPVIAGGKNALILHYIQNDSLLRDGDLLLVDAGGEYQNYASDITRTWPVNGKFTQPQLDIYEAVLDVQKQCIAECRVGNSLDNIQKFAVRLITKSLAKLGIINSNQWGGTHSYAKFYPHAIGHYLGMDTHDVQSIPTSTPLKPGMVITMEPGIYIPSDPTVPEKYHGIGVRIEDDIHITSTGAEILTALAPKEPDQIEVLMRESKHQPK